MTKRTCLAVLGIAALTLGARAAEEVESAEKRVINAWKNHKALRARMTTVQTAEDLGMTLEAHGTGTFELLRAGGKTCFRAEMQNTAVLRKGDKSRDREQTVTYVCDGEYLYSVGEMAGRKMALKELINPLMSADAEVIFKKFHADSAQFALLPEQSLGGQAVFTFEVTPAQTETTTAPSAVNKTVMTFDQVTGVLLKIVQYEPPRNTVTTTTFTEIELDPSIDPKRFKFVLPDGVQLRDRTNR